MKKILVLGSGLTSKPGIVYLLENGFSVTVASRTISKAEKNVMGFDNGKALQLMLEDTEATEKLIQQNDIIVSLLPWIHHLKVAKLCIKNGKLMVTASYVSEEMQKLDREVKEKNLLFLNEIGIDPGIDHMSAMEIIDNVYENGGKIVHFYSTCGGLPAPENNDNPFGYKFSWSPKGVVLASRNAARYLKNGKIIDIEGEDLFLNKHIETIDGLGEFEVYPNRDSMPYKEKYKLKDAKSVMRGTYRNIGWCDTIKKIVDLGLIDDTKVPNLKGLSYKKLLADLIGTHNGDDIIAKVSEKIGLKRDHYVVKNLEWLGLFEDDIVPECDSLLDILSEKLLEKLKYREGEKDMIILRHQFTIENEDKSIKQLTSTLIDYGIPNGDSSMARTVSLPLAIAVKLMAENKIGLTGIQIPIEKEIYKPVLVGLEALNIKMVDKTISQSPERVL